MVPSFDGGDDLFWIGGPGEAFAYLAVALDAYSRRVVGWSLADHLQTSLAMEALTMALSQRRVSPGSLKPGMGYFRPWGPSTLFFGSHRHLLKELHNKRGWRHPP